MYDTSAVALIEDVEYSSADALSNFVICRKLGDIQTTAPIYLHPGAEGIGKPITASIAFGVRI